MEVYSLPTDAQQRLAPLAACARAFESAGFALYAVGGCVRDALLGIPVHDVDITSPAPAAQAEALFTACGFAVVHRDTALGTLGVRLDGEEYEYTAFRSESYGSGGEHRPVQVAFGATMAQDAARRDFTVNALYYRLADGTLADPLGGLKDLRARRLYTCRAPHLTFADDGLRLLRMVRFACTLGFAVPQALRAAAIAHAALLQDVAPERFRGELTRILLCDDVYAALRLMDECTLLTRLLPELEEGRGMAQRSLYHDYDVLYHQLHSCAAAPPNELDRWAALLHDVGKPASRRAQGNMHLHAQLGAPMAYAALQRLKYPNAFCADVSALVRAHMYDLDGRTSLAKLRWFLAAQGPLAPHLITLRRSDVYGSKRVRPAQDPAGRWAQVYVRMQQDGTPFTLKELAVDGRAVMEACGLPPGKALGDILHRLHRWAVADPKHNNPQALLGRARRLCSEIQPTTKKRG